MHLCCTVLCLSFSFCSSLSLGNVSSSSRQDHTVCCFQLDEPLCIFSPQAFSRGVKSCLLVFTIIQAVISSTLSFFLYKERHTSTEYEVRECDRQECGLLLISLDNPRIYETLRLKQLVFFLKADPVSQHLAGKCPLFTINLRVQMI